jgi:LysR family transcriptional activator of nhaA
MFLNYAHLRYFWSVARNGNLTRTAAALNISQSALSAQISKLEDQIGHPLFERRGRTLILTEAGRIAFDHADIIFATGDTLLSRLNAGAAPAAVTVRVGALATLSRNFQMSFLRPVLNDPTVSVQIHSDGMKELLGQLEGHLIDVVLVNQAPAPSARSPWIVQVIDEQPVSLVGPPSLLGATRDPAELLRAAPLIAPSYQSGIRAGLDALLQRLGVTPRIVAEADDMAMLRVLAREGVGLAVLPPIVVQDELQTGLLLEACVLPALRETFSAITMQRRFPNPVVARLLAKQ